MGDTIQSLSSAGGLAALANQVGRAGSTQSSYNKPQLISNIPEVVRQYTQETPELANVKIRMDPRTPGAYLPGSDTISLGAVDPAILAHELGHARNVRQAPLYRTLLGITGSLADVNRTIALPTMLALRAFVGDQQRRREVLNILAGVSAALAAPLLVEELGASVDAVRNVPDKIEAIKTLLPAFAQHTLAATMPMSIYQVGKFI